jgi:hypothetical protein
MHLALTRLELMWVVSALSHSGQAGDRADSPSMYPRINLRSWSTVPPQHPRSWCLIAQSRHSSWTGQLRHISRAGLAQLPDSLARPSLTASFRSFSEGTNSTLSMPRQAAIGNQGCVEGSPRCRLIGVVSTMSSALGVEFAANHTTLLDRVSILSPTKVPQLLLRFDRNRSRANHVLWLRTTRP